MSVTVSYPGVYIEELASASHSVTPAPTSVTVFVGFTNPYWRLSDGSAPPFEEAYEVFSFADYESAFGGFFSSPYLPDYVGQALFQFFENGGSNAYVVGLQSDKYFDFSTDPPTSGSTREAPSATFDDGSGNGFVFTALQPVGVSSQTPPGTAMSVTLSNFTKTDGTDNDTADITIEYGSSVETYRRVLISTLVSTITASSRLVSVETESSTDVTAYNDLSATSVDFTYAGGDPTQGTVLIDLTKFADVFAANAPLDKVPIFNLLLLPGITDPAVLAEALAYAEQKRAFYIMDPPENAVSDEAATHLADAPANAAAIADILSGATPPPLSANGALYFPYLRTTDPVTLAPLNSPPSGYVAGIFAREDVGRGVWKSPAGLETTILGTTGVVPWGVMTDPQNGVLYTKPNYVNCLRSFPGVGTVVFGARTLVSANDAFEQWRYVAVRRMALFIEQSLYGSLKWAIFEPNDEPLWTALTTEVKAFMLGLYRQGAFQGTADKAFRVQCDATTTSQDDINNGIVNIIVSFAPLKPAEYVVVKIAQLAGQSTT
ncbi:MAG TPA: phage tail sheath C-terminal domain-containing protein [Gaiellaceae bacterium]|nr:phage tail sheath C-terminal domain-containing protein [Gaiellaceae bacterium]